MKKEWFKIRGKVIYSRRSTTNLKDAWEKTLLKWSLISEGHRDGSSGSTCGLCNLFLSQACVECPVSQITKQFSCEGTPYDLSRSFPLTESQRRLAALIELNFLKAVKKATIKRRRRK
jgi:hypothetical protein